MEVIVFYCLWALNFFCVLAKKKYKCLTIVTILYACYIYFANAGSSDYNAYYNIWLGLDEEYQIELGFQLLIDLSKLLGLSFNQFQGIICSLSLLLTIYVFGKFSDNYQFFFAIYFIYQYFADMNVLRNFMARAILAVAILMFVKCKKIYFLLFVLLSMLFHKTSIIYLPLVFLNWKSIKHTNLMKCFAISVMGICVIIFMTGNNFIWLFEIAKIFLREDPSRLYTYFSSSTRYGFIIYFILHLASLYMNYIGRSKAYMTKDSTLKALYQSSIMMNLYLIAVFPLIMMNTDFYRLYNNLYLINILFSVTMLDSYLDNNRQYYEKLIQILIINLGWTFPLVAASNQRGLILNSLSGEI